MKDSWADIMGVVVLMAVVAGLAWLYWGLWHHPQPECHHIECQR